jgi:hypothetical protein
MTDLTYILAASHSGSTLLAMLLATHRQVCTMGEMKATELGDATRYRCSCGSWIRQCTFWRGVQEAMGGRGVAFDVAAAGTDFGAVGGRYVRRLCLPLHRGPVAERCRDAALGVSGAWRRSLPAVQRRNALLAEVLCELTGSQVIVDSSKTALRLKYLLCNEALNIRVIHLVRDGRAVALATMRPDRYADAADLALRQGGAGGIRAEEWRSMAQAARQWRRSNEEALHLLGALRPSQWIDLRYEAFCADPEGHRRRLFRFLGLDPAEAHPVEQFRQAAGHVIGNGMRLDTETTIAPDQRWRSVLTDEHLAVFDRVAGRLNRRLGYGDDAARTGGANE